MVCVSLPVHISGIALSALGYSPAVLHCLSTGIDLVFYIFSFADMVMMANSDCLYTCFLEWFGNRFITSVSCCP